MFSVVSSGCTPFLSIDQLRYYRMIAGETEESVAEESSDSRYEYSAHNVATEPAVHIHIHSVDSSAE